MTTTPVSKSKLSCKDVKAKIDTKKENDLTALHTPNKNLQTDQEGDYSPVFLQLTQETNEEIDVLWDWHSPQSSHRRRKKQKRLVPVQSPKFPLKRHASNNQNQNFERLRNELKALQEELAVPDDESCLCVSPQQESEFKAGEGNNIVLEEEPPHPCDDFDLFNDSMDEQLVLFSQKLEDTLVNKNEAVKSEEKEFNFTKICDTTDINNLINKYSEKKITIKDEPEKKIAIKDEPQVTTENINTSKNSKVSFQRTLSDNLVTSSTGNIIQTVSGKLEFHRTKSFELAGLNGQVHPPKISFEEIERKRLEAKAKLESKMKKDIVIKSPPKCSPEEIEKKRLQALAKLEAKRLKEIVEKKRQEALKKLQVSRLKNASQVKGTLSKRL